MIITVLDANTGRDVEIEVLKVHRNKKLNVKFIQLIDGSILKSKGACLYGNYFREYRIPDYQIEGIEQDG